MNDPIFYNLFDKAYNAVARVMPESFQKHPEILAGGLGAVGGYVLTRGIQLGIKKISPEFYDTHLPKMEQSLAVLVCAAPLAYAIFDPEGAKALMSQHPVYSTGVSMGLVGSATAAFQDSNKSRTKSTLIDDLAKHAGYTKNNTNPKK